MAQPGNELWEFDDEGYVKKYDASINDYEIDESERKLRFARMGEADVEKAG